MQLFLKSATVQQICCFVSFYRKSIIIEVTFVDSTDMEAIGAAIRSNTRLIHIETPGNPTTEISEIQSIATSAISK